MLVASVFNLPAVIENVELTETGVANVTPLALVLLIYNEVNDAVFVVALLRKVPEPEMV